MLTAQHFENRPEGYADAVMDLDEHNRLVLLHPSLPMLYYCETTHQWRPCSGERPGE